MNLRKTSLVVTTLVLTMMLMSTISGSVDLSSNISDGSNRFNTQHQDALLAPKSQHSHTKTSAEGDKTFVEFRQACSEEGQDNEAQMDLWGPATLLEPDNLSEWMLELFINETDVGNDYLHIVAHLYDGSQIYSTPDYYLLDDCLNASIWGAQFTGSVWNIVVAGTHVVGGNDVAFLMLLAFDGETFSTDDAELELTSDSEETYITDLKIQNIDSDPSEEVLMCGYSYNTSSGFFDGLLWIYNVTAVAGPLVFEHECRWSDSSGFIKTTALDTGLLGGLATHDVLVVGYENTTGIVLARFDYFWSGEYDPNAGSWQCPNISFTIPGDVGIFHDVVLGDVDSDSECEIVLVGSYGVPVYGAMWIFSFTLGGEVVYGLNSVWNGSAIYEVEAYNLDSSSHIELVTYGRVYNATAAAHYMVLIVWDYDGTAFTSLQFIISNVGRDDITHFAELCVGDTDGNGEVELWSCASYVNGSGVPQRNETIFDLLVDIEGPPGRWHTPRDDSVRPAHTPTPGEVDDTPPWEAPVTASLLETWTWPSIWLALSSLLLAGLLILLDKERPKSLITAGGVAAAIVLLGLVAGAVLLAPAWVTLTSQAGWETFLGVFGGAG